MDAKMVQAVLVLAKEFPDASCAEIADAVEFGTETLRDYPEDMHYGVILENARACLVDELDG